MTNDAQPAAPAKPRKRDRLKKLGTRLIHSDHMLLGIGIASFLEALIIPIPLETILLPLMQARRSQMWIISTVVLLGCLIAAAVGYAVGYFIFDAVGAQLVSMVSSQEQFEQVRDQMQQKGFWFVFSVGVVPIPFQIAMLAAGATKFSFGMFMFASLLSRGIRYYGLALLVLIAGNRAQRLFERHKVPVSLAFLAIVAIAWVAAII